MKKFATIVTLCLAGIILVTWLMIGCARAASIKLAWNANPETNITDYRVWRGLECLATVSGTAATVTVPDEPCTITVTARNPAGESAHSAPLNLLTITVEESTDLTTWAAVRMFHWDRKTQAFYRIKLETEARP